MGTFTLSGVLKRPVSGEVVPDARITFDAIATGFVVLNGVSASCKTDSNGGYSVSLEYGDYAIQVSWAGQTQQYGSVHIDDTTPVGSLNDLLMAQTVESQVTPEIIIEFRQLEQEMQEQLAEMEQLNEEAGQSATDAGNSAAAAKISEENSAASETAAAASAAQADASAQSTEDDAQAADASAEQAALSETNAATSAANAGISERNAAISEDNAALSASEAATSASEASTSEVSAAASASAAGEAQASAAASETAAAASEAAAETSEINAENARDAAEEYAQEAKDAASKVTDPLTDRGQWAIQAGYPDTPDVASVWQITDGGADPENADIIWNCGDMLLWLASTATWCRVLGREISAEPPQALTVDGNIILGWTMALQVLLRGTDAVNAVSNTGDNYLTLGDDLFPGINLQMADPAELAVVYPDGNGGHLKKQIYSQACPPPAPVFSPDMPGSVLLAALNGLPSDYPLYPTADNPTTMLFPEDGYLFSGSALVYGGMKESGAKYWLSSSRIFTGSWALLSGLVMEYNTTPNSAPYSGNFLVQSVDVTTLGAGPEHIRRPE